MATKFTVSIATWRSTTGHVSKRFPAGDAAIRSTLIDCLHGQPPDPFWVGQVDAEAFVGLAADLLALLTERDYQNALTFPSLARWLGNNSLNASHLDCALGKYSVNASAEKSG